MKQIYKFLTTASLCACALPAVAADSPGERLIVVNEGTWQADNGRLSYFEDGAIVSNQWFREVNGKKLGDTPNDIIQVKPDLIAIAVNWSNIVQFINEKGERVAETEDVPNNRKLASDGEYVYVTSYAHECETTSGLKTFTRGYVAKIELEDFKVVDAVEVGYEPEGIACYKGKLFVANSGGYAFQEGHDYEQTVSVIDIATFSVENEIDTGQINLYGSMAQSGQYLCINSPGDYYSVPAATVILDCDAFLEGKVPEDCCVRLDFASTYSTTSLQGTFYAIGSSYSYITGDYEFTYRNIDPAEVMASQGIKGITDDLPGSLVENISEMSMPYGLYVNPYSGYVYATDAAGFVEGGTLYQWTPDGKLLGTFGVYINPGHFLALNPDQSGDEPGGDHGGVGYANADTLDNSPLLNLQGMPVTTPRKGEIYIQNGKKFIYK